MSVLVAFIIVFLGGAVGGLVAVIFVMDRVRKIVTKALSTLEQSVDQETSRKS